MLGREVILSSEDEHVPPKELPQSKTKKVQKPLTDSLNTNSEAFVNRNSDIENKNKPKKQKTVEETYKKLSQIDHVLTRPDSYIGSTEAVSGLCWTFDETSSKIVQKNVTFIPGFYKIIDEILVNAADNKIRDPTMDTIKITVDKDKNILSVYNNGQGIPIEIHKGENRYVPEMIFGHLLTSSNYDDKEKKIVGGRNGLGAKLANIYSIEFIVETADKNTKKKYRQVFKNNMKEIQKPKITNNQKEEEYTKITFMPDLKRFNMSSLDDDICSLLKRRAYDLAGTLPNTKVFLNNQRLRVKNFKQYIELYAIPKDENSNKKNKSEVKTENEDIDKKESNEVNEVVVNNDNESPEKEEQEHIKANEITYERVNDRWEVGYVLSEGQFQQVSFVNNIATTKGGSHVNYIVDQITTQLIDHIKKKNKSIQLKPFQIKNHLWIFINSRIENPAFDSQTKENMTSKVSTFGSKCVLSQQFIKKVISGEIVDRLVSFATFKQQQALKKTDGKKSSRISGIVKLEDANNAGTKKSKNCILILTEGDSAKALAVSGLGIIGRDNYGVFPLRGKLLNVRDAPHTQIMNNTEISHIKQILGLKHGKAYDSVDELRYGHIMIMTDQDHDGSHIKGLIINFFDHFYSSLLKVPGFLMEFITPIVKVTKKKEQISFFTIPEYLKWKEENDDGKGWHIKYYKGLGTSTSEDGKKYFSDLSKHVKSFASIDSDERKLIELAFSKKKADNRKEWLREYTTGTYMDHTNSTITIKDFINKELILFSMADNIRSIPSVIDGLKPGQRKVLFACFKRKLKDEIKVSQLVGYIAEHTAYHHGEQSLVSTIVGMAQDFVGSNNINILDPVGQFGTRAMGGKDCSSARYINTKLMKITRLIYHNDDDPLFKYLNEDNQSIEPEWYMPVIPTVLINGSEGIGTGWSSFIPNYNPSDIIENIKNLMDNKPLLPMKPWYRKFKGNVEQVGTDKYELSGVIEKIDDNKVRITELPVRVWTTSYKKQLHEWLDGTEKTPSSIDYINEHHTDSTVDFVIGLTDKQMRDAEKEGLMKKFRLVSQMCTSNMVCFSPEGRLKKYTSPEEILEEFYYLRLEYYQKRKEYQLSYLTKEWAKLEDKVRFILEIIEGTLVIKNRKKDDIIKDLKMKEYKPFFANEFQSGNVNDDSDNEDKNNGYDYLLSMPLWSLTYEKVQQLLKKKQEAEDELNRLASMTTIQIWKNDLDKISAAWEEIKGNLETTQYNPDIKQKTKRKKATKKKIKEESSNLDSFNNTLKNDKPQIKKDSDSDFESKKPKVKKQSNNKKQAKLEFSKKETFPKPTEHKKDTTADIVKKEIKVEEQQKIGTTVFSPEADETKKAPSPKPIRASRKIVKKETVYKEISDEESEEKISEYEGEDFSESE